MQRSIVFMFSGQGAQYYHMGKELFDHDRVFRETLQRCDDIVGPLVDASIVEMLYRPRANKFEPFEKTLYTHPALVMFSYALAQAVMARGVQPSLLLGYSLGEFTAGVLSGAMDLESGLRGTVRQAKMLESQCEPGGMIAILEKPDLMDRRPDLFDETWLAGVNFERHFVVTAKPKRIQQLQADLERLKVTVQVLPVTRGFHSPLVAGIADRFHTLIDSFSPVQKALVSARSASRIPAMDGDHLLGVLVEPVRFLDTVRYLEREGPHTYIDIGPAMTLATFARNCFDADSRSLALGTLNQFGKDLKAIDQLTSELGL